MMAVVSVPMYDMVLPPRRRRIQLQSATMSKTREEYYLFTFYLATYVKAGTMHR
jgi:hypothetical protein